MDVRLLKRCNMIVIVLLAACLHVLAAGAPWGSVMLGLWSAAPMLVFIPPLLAFGDATGQRCMLVAMAGFGLLAVMLVFTASRPTDPLSFWAAWIVPAWLVVGATIAASIGAVTAKFLRDRVRAR